MYHILDDLIALAIVPTTFYLALRLSERPPKMNLHGLYTITWYNQNQRQTRTCYLTTDRHRIYHRTNRNQRWRHLCYTDQIITCYKHGN